MPAILMLLLLLLLPPPVPLQGICSMLKAFGQLTSAKQQAHCR
jgi:hypothetical protein